MSSIKIKNFSFHEILLIIAIIIYFGNFFAFLGGSITLFDVNQINQLFKNISFLNILDFLRVNYSILGLTANVIIFIIIFKLNKVEYVNLFSITILLLFTPQILGFLNFFLRNEGFEIQSFSMILQIFSGLLNILNIFFLKTAANKKYLKLLFIIPLVGLIFQFLLFFLNFSFLDFEYGGYNLILNVGSKSYNLYFNSNGLGRTCAIFYIFSIFYYFESKYITKKIISLFFSSFFLFLILLLSGRFNSLGIIIINIILIFYYKKQIIKDWFVLSICLLFTILSTDVYKNAKKKLIIKNEGKNSIEYKSYETNNSSLGLRNTNIITTELERILGIETEDANDNDTNFKINIITKINNLSTGRLAKWIFIIKYNNNYYFGQGPNRDRIFFSNKIKETLSHDSQSLTGANDAASGILYNYITAGIFGIICMIIFYLILIKVFVNKLLSQESDYFFKVYSTIFVFLTFRVIFENGYFIFGIDFLLLLISCLVLFNNEKKTI